MKFRLSFGRCSLAAVLIFAVAGYGHADSIALVPTQDVYVWSGGATKNHNDDGDGLSIGPSTRIYIQWDLTEIPANSTINAAYIELTQWNNSGATTTTTTASYLTSGFDETLLTWDSSGAGDPGGTPLTSLGVFGVIDDTLGPKQSGSANADERLLLQSIYEGDGVFTYFMSATSGGFRLFVNREGTGGDVDDGPRLVIDYTPIPEPSALLLGAFGIGCIGFVARRKWTS